MQKPSVASTAFLVKENGPATTRAIVGPRDGFSSAIFTSTPSDQEKLTNSLGISFFPVARAATRIRGLGMSRAPHRKGRSELER